MNKNNKILSDITVHMKYAKYIPELNRRETWEELVTRNKEMHQKRYPDLYNEIEENYRYVYKKKVLPSIVVTCLLTTLMLLVKQCSCYCLVVALVIQFKNIT